MPFITEEIWQNLSERGEKETVCLAPYPQPGAVDTDLLEDFDRLIELVTALRNLRNTKNLSPKTALPLAIRTDSKARYETLADLIQKLANVSEITFITDQADGMSFLVRSDEFFVDLAGEVDTEAERETLLADLKYYRRLPQFNHEKTRQRALRPKRQRRHRGKGTPKTSRRRGENRDDQGSTGAAGVVCVKGCILLFYAFINR